MSRPVMIMGSLWVVLGGAGLALAQDAPPLEPPATDPPQPTVSAPTTVSAPPVSARPEVRPLLVIPGVTAPTQRGGPAPKSKTAQPSGAANPSDRSSPPRPLSGARVESVPAPSSRSKVPLTLEPIDDEPAVKSKAPTSSTSRGPLDWPPGVPLANERPPVASPSDPASTTPATPRSAPSRVPGILGRFFGPAPSSTPRIESRNSQSQTRIDVDPRPGPISDADTKRRIEREIKDSLGDRLRSVEVRVSGRNVLIVARASRFWQRRSVRQSLETLPGLAGYRARVDIIE
jgi:hypothetical protein